MRAILYLKQILLTQPHLKKYYFPICAKCVELVGDCREDHAGDGAVWVELLDF